LSTPTTGAEPIANLEWSLYVACPQCNESNDLSASEHDHEDNIARHIFGNDWDKLQGWEVTCEHCGHEFKIEKVEY
jgi:DNA-directed RNA polymerase subunit RPC12/RpoP